MSVLDLCKLDKEGLVSNNLRQLWILKHGEDPLRLARDAARMPTNLMLAGLVFFLATNCMAYTWSTHRWGDLFVFFPSLLSALLSLCCAVVFLGAGIRGKKGADEFSRLLQQAASIWRTPPEVIAEWGMKELEKTAKETLRHEAGLLQEYEKEERPRELIEKQRDGFRETHRVFRELGLAEKTWNPYFKKEEKEEEPAAALAAEPAEPAPTST